MKHTPSQMLAAWQVRCLVALFAVMLGAFIANPQPKPGTDTSSEHEDQILGVRVGMRVPDALKAVFEHTATMPAPEKPDALREEGKGKKDIRVLYKNLKEGELQIVFAGGKTGFVREVTLTYAKQPTMSDLHLPWTGSIAGSGDVLNSQLNSGTRIDDRYSVGYTDDRKTERFWWRDDQSKGGYAVRVGFISKKLPSVGSIGNHEIARKVVMVKPGDEQRFWNTVAPK